jgi:hypothetical protein
MKAPRISRLIIVFQSILLLICLGFLGFFIVLSYGLKLEAEDYASQAGFDHALRNYLKQRPSIYETKLFEYGEDSGPIPTDGTIEPAHKREYGLPVFYYMVSKDLPKAYKEIQQAYVDSYDKQMREYFEHPEEFDNSGLRLWESPTGTTNSI